MSWKYGGSSIWNDWSTMIRPAFRSNRRKLAIPRYLSLYSSSGAYPFGAAKGWGKKAFWTRYSLFVREDCVTVIVLGVRVRRQI